MDLGPDRSRSWLRGLGADPKVGSGISDQAKSIRAKFVNLILRYALNRVIQLSKRLCMYTKVKNIADQITTTTHTQLNGNK